LTAGKERNNYSRRRILCIIKKKRKETKNRGMRETTVWYPSKK